MNEQFVPKIFMGWDTCAFLKCPQKWTIERTDAQHNTWRVCEEHARQLWPGLYPPEPVNDGP